MSDQVALGRRFTLSQLFVLLVALAVIIAIAIPAHRTRLLRMRREEATQALRRIQAAQERYLIQYNRYASRLAAALPQGLGLPETTPHARYTLRLEVDDLVRPSRFTARALANDAAAGDTDPNCHSFSLDQNGIRNARDSSGADRTALCWR